MGKHRGLPRTSDPVIDFNFYFLKDVLRGHVEGPSTSHHQLHFWNDVIGDDKSVQSASVGRPTRTTFDSVGMTNTGEGARTEN